MPLEPITFGGASAVPSEQKKPTIRAAGYLLNKSSFGMLAAILLLAAWNAQSAIVLLVSLFLSAVGLARLWSVVSLLGVQFHHHLSEHRIFPGEKIDFKLQITNRKPLPLPWIQVEDRISAGLGADTSIALGAGQDPGIIRRSAAMFWYSAANWRMSLKGEKRGYYQIGPASVVSGDIFGFYTRSMTVPLIHHITVYPRIFPLDFLDIPSLHPMGESKTTRRIFQDPTRAMGVRDYRYQDSLRHIHWKASARCSQLQVKVFEATTTYQLALFLDVNSFQENDSFCSDDFELGISLAASIALHGVDEGCPVGLFVNSRLIDSGQPISMVPSGSQRQLTDILEALAKVTAFSSGPMDAFMDMERRFLSAGTTVVLIFAKPPDFLRGLLADLKEAGHQLLILLIGDHAEVDVDEAVPWKRVKQPEMGGYTEKSIS